MSSISSCVWGMDKWSYGNVTESQSGKSDVYLERKVVCEEAETVQKQSKGTAEDSLIAYKVLSGNKSGMLSSGVEIEPVSLLSQTSTVQEKVENDKYIIIREQAMQEFWIVYNKKTGERGTFLPGASYMEIDENTGEKYLLWSMCGFLSEAMKVDEQLESALKEFMGVDEVETSSLNISYEIRTDEFTGIDTIMPKGNVIQGISFIENEEQAYKLEVLAEKYMKDYPNLIEDMDEARKYAIYEVKGRCWRDSTGILMLANNALIYEDDKNPNRGWSIRIEGDLMRENLDLVEMIVEAIEKEAVEGGFDNLDGWLSLFEKQDEDRDEKRFTYHRYGEVKETEEKLQWV